MQPNLELQPDSSARPRPRGRRRGWLPSILGALLLLVCVGTVSAAARLEAAEPAPRPAVSEKFQAAEIGGVPGEYIVTLADGTSRSPYEAGLGLPSVGEVAEILAEAYEVEVIRVWEHALKGFHIRADELDAQRLASDPLVLEVYQDRRVMSLRTLPQGCYPLQNQATAPKTAEGKIAFRTHVVQQINCDDPDPRNPTRDCTENWGLDRIDQISGVRDEQYTYNGAGTGTGVHVYVLDTGIDATHPEFQTGGQSRVTFGYNAIAGSLTSPNLDCYGHGTHVAGIVGGNVNGVAKGVEMHSVKYVDGGACDTPGAAGGNHSDVMAGLNWIRQTHNFQTMGPAVVNLSSNFWDRSAAFDLAVQNLLAAGITLVQSAGNQLDEPQPMEPNGDACFYSFAGISGLEDVIVVGATDWNAGESPIDGRWIRETNDPSYSLCTGPNEDCGSNSGSCVDLWAPGGHIISARGDQFPVTTDEFCRLSGTSMAAPHATGVAALYLEGAPAGAMDPADVQAALVGGATCGVLDSDPSSPYYIGDGSPNLLLNVGFNGGGPGGCPTQIFDSFTGNGALHGRPTEVGGVTWTAHPGAETRGGILGDAPAIGGLPFQLSQVPSTSTLSLTARVNPTQAEWIGVGYASQATAPYWSGGELWVLIAESGVYQVHALGSIIASGTVATTLDAYYDLDVRYRDRDRLASVRIEGVEVASQVLAASPAVSHVGLHVYNASEGTAKVDDFDLRVLGAGQALLADGFSGSGPLHGRPTETGTATWSARRGGIVSGGVLLDSTAIGSVPLDVSQLPGTPTLTLSALVRPSGAGWNGVGFAGAAASPLWNSGRLWVLLRPSGTYAVHDSTGSVGTGAVPGVSSGLFHQVKIEYDTGTGVGTVTLNGQQVFSQAVSASGITQAGVHLHIPDGNDQIDDFEVTWTP